MSSDLQQENDDYNPDYDDQDNCEDQDNEQQYQGSNEGGDDNDDDGDVDDEGNENDDEQDDQDDQDQKNNRSGGGGFGGDGPKFIRLRGLPWSATHKEILDFLKNINVINGSKGIHLVTSRWDGKNTGEAFVEVQSEADVEEALKLNKNMMGHRYIEVFSASPKDAHAAMKKTGGPGQSFVVKLRGLPYAVTEQQVEEFFNGLEIKPDREGILFVMDRRGRATGEAYVQFESQEDTELALGRNREKIGHRYIEIFRSSLAELKRSAYGNGRPGPYDLKDRGGNRGDFGGGRNNMRGGGGGNDWNNGGNGGNGFGGGANNTLGFNNFNNSGNFGNGFGNNGGGNGGNFGNNSGGGGGGGGGFGGNNGGGFGGTNNNRFNGPNNIGGGGGGSVGSGGNFSSDFGDFGNFGNNRNNNFNNGPNEFGGNSGGFGGRNNTGNFGGGVGVGVANMGNFGNFGNGPNDGPNNMVGGGFNNGNMGNNGGGNFGPIGGGRTDNEFFSVHMRGLPYSSYENDIFKFFDPIRPSNVRINFNKKGLHSGTADVFFDTIEDAQLAMKRHKDQIGNRYIELFFDGKIKAGGGNNNNINNNNNNNNNNNAAFQRRF